MSSIFAIDPIYITVSQIKGTTTSIELQNEDSLVVQGFIYLAQRHIDDFLVRYGTKFDENQDFIFPIDNNGESLIPKEITEATFFLVEYLYRESKRESSFYGDTIKSIQEGDTSITFDTNKDILQAKELTLAFSYLRNLKRNSFKITP